MVTSKIRNRQASRRIVMRWCRRLFGFCAGAAALIIGFAVIQSAGPVSAQDGTQPGLVQPPGSASPSQPTTDPITNEQIELLKVASLKSKAS
jgi:hypothetical protein